MKNARGRGRMMSLSKWLCIGLLCVPIAILVPVCGCAQSDARTSALDDMSVLDKNITLSVRAASLREVLAKVQADTGIKMRASREVAEDKATIWVKDRPARDVLRALAHCFNLGWVVDDSEGPRVLHLVADPNYLEDMRRRRYEDFLAITSQFDAEMNAAALFVRSGEPYQYTQEEITSQPNQDEQWRLMRRSRFSSSAELGAAILQYLHLTEQQRKDLLDGKDITVSGSSIDAEAQAKYPEAKSFVFWVERSIAGYLLQGTVQPYLQPQNWVLYAVALFDDSRYAKVIRTSNDILLKDPALDRELPAEEVPVSTPVEPAPVVQENLVEDMRGKAVPLQRPGEGSGATPATMSDSLLGIAEATQTPVVAQYLSEYAEAYAASQREGIAIRKSSARKVSERLAEMCRAHTFKVDRDGDFLLAKSLLWHRLRAREVPEATVRRWQKDFAGLLLPTFESSVEMGSLTWDQVRGVIGNGLYWFGISEPMSSLAQSEYALKLYASLNMAQRQALQRGMPIQVLVLSPQQQHLFIQAFEHRARPTYAQAQDPDWARNTTFSLVDRGLADNTLYAVTGMRYVAAQDFQLDMPSEESPSQSENYLDRQTRLAAVADRQLSGIARQFAALVLKEHPEITQKTLGIYCMRITELHAQIGEESNESWMPHFRKVPW